MGIPVFRGTFGPAQAERLLWRAGFGPRRGDVARTAKLGLAGAVRSLTRPGTETLVGPEPHDEKGNPLAPFDAWGHDHLWWLDRMVRTTTPLVERMTLIWHDWFATSNDQVGSQELMIDQNNLFRSKALGNFSDLLLSVTQDPAMLIWLNGIENRKGAPNENYGRELMELFTLGADRPGGYTEDDVREQARSFTGFRADWSDSLGRYTNFRFDPKRHDTGTKTVFGKTGTFDYTDSCKLVLQHPNHASFFVGKLWSYFVPAAPDTATMNALCAMYAASYEVQPVVEAILMHPAVYTGPAMVKPPVVYNAGLLRALGRGIDTSDWVWLGDEAGQRLFYPPNVAGWDDTRWLDTATFRGRWDIANYAFMTTSRSEKARVPRTAAKLYAAALASSGSPHVSAGTDKLLRAYVSAALADAKETWEQEQYPPLIFNALRQLVAVTPDFQTS